MGIKEDLGGNEGINRVNAQQGFDAFRRELDLAPLVSVDSETSFLVVGVDHVLNERWDAELVLTGQYTNADWRWPMSSDPAQSDSSPWDAEIYQYYVDARARYTGPVWGITFAAMGGDIDIDSDIAFNFTVPFGPLGVAQVTQRLTRDSNRPTYSALVFAGRRLGTRWAIDLGLRLQHFAPDVRLVERLARTSSTGDPLADAVIDGILGAVPAVDSDETDSHTELLPVASLSFHLHDSLTVGAKIERAVRPGDVSTNLARGETATFGPEFAWGYELFARSVLMDGAVYLNANVYLTDFEDQQVNACLSSQPFDCQEANAQRSRAYGLELEATWAINDAWTVWAAIGLLDTEFEKFEIGILDWTGNEFPEVSDQSYSVGARFDRGLGLYAQVDANYESDAFATPSNAPDVVRDDRFLVNARIGWRHDSWDVSMFARNLFDEEYFNWISPDLPSGQFQLAFPGHPQEIGVELRVNW